mmetsp:Transcript_38219/g.126569  ORF Transcript_38219/g.126569 Transcript_38219/m.126569 type:complete len:257 (-) Transcript_38219:1642-2412(-)
MCADVRPWRAEPHSLARELLPRGGGEVGGGGGGEQPRQQRDAVHRRARGGGGVEPGEGEEGWREVDVGPDLGEGLRRDARPTEEHGHADRVVVHGELARGEVVLAEVVPMVGRHEEVRPAPEAERLERRRDGGDGVIDGEEGLPALAELAVDGAHLVRQQRPLARDHAVVICQPRGSDSEGRGPRGAHALLVHPGAFLVPRGGRGGVVRRLWCHRQHEGRQQSAVCVAGRAAAADRLQPLERQVCDDRCDVAAVLR